MPWYAVESLGDALDATKALLLPFDAGQWLRLALVVFFLGGIGGGGPSAGAGGSTSGPSVTPSEGPGGVPPGEVPFDVETVLPVVAGAVVVVVVLGLLYALVGSLMEFVFVESLRRQHVRIRRYADQHAGHALRLFVFRFLLGLLVVVPAVAIALAALTAVGGDPQVSIGLVAVLVPLFVVVGLVVALVDLFTTNFVVPVMIAENLGVLAGWRRFWPTLTGQWKQYAVYVLVRFVLAVAVGVVGSVVGGVVGAVLVAPLAVLGVLAFPAIGGPAALLSNPFALAVVALVVVSYLVVLTAAMAVAFVPVQTYLRYHALLVLGDTDRGFDLIPGLRREIRGE